MLGSLETILFKDLKKVTKKLECITCRREFLEDCRYFGIIPKFMGVKKQDTYQILQKWSETIWMETVEKDH